MQPEQRSSTAHIHGLSETRHLEPWIKTGNQYRGDNVRRSERRRSARLSALLMESPPEPHPEPPLYVQEGNMAGGERHAAWCLRKTNEARMVTTFVGTGTPWKIVSIRISHSLTTLQMAWRLLSRPNSIVQDPASWLTPPF
jgi:hypothetical protein